MITKTIPIVVNGKPSSVREASRLDTLVCNLGVKGRFAVEVNGEIVPRGQLAVQVLQSGDRIEIVQAVGGG